MAVSEFDLVVIGSGPGGYVAAIRASQLGLRTCVVEADELGGVCLNWGCIPTKALLHVATLKEQIEDAGALGLDIGGPLKVDMSRVMAHSRKVAATLNGGVTGLLRKNKVTVKMGRACFRDAEHLEITPKAGKTTDVVKAKNIIIATGARPRVLKDFPVDNQRIWDYKGALASRELPESLLVLGAGAIGLEFANFYAALGTRVTVVEQQDQILPSEDVEISQELAQRLGERGITILTGSRARLVTGSGQQHEVIISGADGEQSLSFEKILVSVGVAGNIEAMGLENTRVRTADGFVVTDDNGLTGQPGVYAIGDVAGPPMLAHKASHEGIRCAEYIAGHVSEEPRTHDIPACVYTRPQVARIGLTEQQARDQGRDIAVGRFPFLANGKAVAITATEGFIKTIFDKKTGQLLGAHLIGPDVTELLHGLTMAQQLEATEETLMNHMFAHPTLSEALGESAMAAYRRALHI